MNNNNSKVIYVKEFTLTPGPRHRWEGDYSGEEFREKVLRPSFEEARRENVKLIVDLDGTEGYPASFLEESFGGLAREVGVSNVQRYVEVHSAFNKFLIEEVNEYIQSANQPVWVGY